jgi:hypothetical protein
MGSLVLLSKAYLCNEFALMNMKIRSTNTACFDFDLLEVPSDIWLAVQEQDWSVALYHDIVLAHRG